MAVSNAFLSDSFSVLAKLMDIHGENPFKIKSYAAAAFNIDRMSDELSALPRENIAGIKGIGASIGRQVIEMLDSGQLPQLEDLKKKTPPGVLEMLKIKGLGPKKIATVWKEMEIESIGELLYACNENRLLTYKGFGEKSQNQIADTITFYLGSQGSFLYAELEGPVLSLQKKIRANFPGHRISATGAFRRQLEIVDLPECITDLPAKELESFLADAKLEIVQRSETGLIAKSPENISFRFRFVDAADYPRALFEGSCSEVFAETWKKESTTQSGHSLPAAPAGETGSGNDGDPSFHSDHSIFIQAGLSWLPPALRETASHVAMAKTGVPDLIHATDIRGIIHSHSTWSDGAQTLEQMADACIAQGFEYLVISDHSKSAFYANGLSEERILEQHKQIAGLNAKLAPFRIFKSIECDILNDGSLDYRDEVLASFDLVITSIHSNLKMSPEKAMQRLLGAVQNPYTRILGHCTGRLLLSRPGYPVDHQALIDACAANNVVIELNAHPRRLDMDWRWIPYALEKNVMISIDPDAHSIAGFHDVHYGVLAAQKAAVTPRQNLSSLSLAEFGLWLKSKPVPR